MRVGRIESMVGEDRVAVVTGGSSGIGLSVARQLAQEGCHVWLVARDPERLSAALEQVRSARKTDRQHFASISADVADPVQAASAVEMVIHEGGVPHLLVNSAGVAKPGYVQELTLDEFRWMMDINYFGAVHMVKAVLPGMLERGSGHIVNVSSAAGFMGVYGYSAYGASKFALSGFSDVLRAEMKRRGIQVSIAFLQDVDTPQLAYESQFRPPETRALVEGPKIWSPESVAEKILRGVRRGQYTINIGTAVIVSYWLSRVLGTAAYPVMDLVHSFSLWQARFNHRH